MIHETSIEICGLSNPGDPKYSDGSCWIDVPALTSMLTEDIYIAERLRRDSLCSDGWNLFSIYYAKPQEELDALFAENGIDSIGDLIGKTVRESRAYLLSLTRAEEVIETLMPMQDLAKWHEKRAKLLRR